MRQGAVVAYNEIRWIAEKMELAGNCAVTEERSPVRYSYEI